MAKLCAKLVCLPGSLLCQKPRVPENEHNKNKLFLGDFFFSAIGNEEKTKQPS